jgi:hypothetical protein
MGRDVMRLMMMTSREDGWKVASELDFITSMKQLGLSSFCLFGGFGEYT